MRHSGTDGSGSGTSKHDRSTKNRNLTALQEEVRRLSERVAGGWRADAVSTRPPPPSMTGKAPTAMDPPKDQKQGNRKKSGLTLITEKGGAAQREISLGQNAFGATESTSTAWTTVLGRKERTRKKKEEESA